MATTYSSSSESPTVVSNMEFAEEVRHDRLDLWWKFMLAVGLTLLLAGFMRLNSNGLTIATIATFLALGAFTSGRILKHGNYTLAAWILNLAAVAAITYPVFTGNPHALRIAPLLYPFIVFTIGLMLPPIHTFGMWLIITLLAFLVPMTVADISAVFNPYHFAGGILALLSAMVAGQITGELLQVADWALDNYSRERRTSLDLFENRQQLEKTLQRSQVLGEKLQEINGELESAKHFRGQFLANMSHELRTPLNAIIGFSETMLAYPMMYDNVELPEAYRHDLQQIHTSGGQLLTIINDILDLSKVDAGKLEVHLERTNLEPIIDKVMMTAAGLVSKKPVELKRNLPRHLPDVYVDEARLQQVLVNLYSNAAKFTEKGYVEISVSESADEIQISVRDTGEGIREDALETIFEEFTQTENRGRDPRAGAGLGLTISRRLVTLMNGRIWAESTYGEGSTFHVVIPKYDEVNEETSPELAQVTTIEG